MNLQITGTTGHRSITSYTASGTVVAHVRELYVYRELLWRWVSRNVKVRYKQSFLGVAWAVLQPLSTTLLFTLVFAYLVPVATDGVPYPIFYYSALLPWTLFASSVSFGTQSLVSNMNLVTKIYFPKEILPVSSVLASLVDFGRPELPRTGNL